ncbi:ferrochelatase [Elongatibacter sediminis]|uniref:ferrochelatase n=1 Tax=Elongatibacter sediminis TaxID=3119006 RepID=UPI00339DA671
MPASESPARSDRGGGAERRRGVLLANLGTPAAPERRAVARFLREFLSDPRVVDLPRWLWLPLLNGVIIPLRAGRSAAAYRAVWREDGSPLLVFTQRLAGRLAAELGPATHVAIGMRYGQPSIRDALAGLRDDGVDELVVLPLYPQFSGTTTASIFDAVDAGLGELDWQPVQRRIEDYHVHPAWVGAVADSIRQYRQQHGEPDQLLFSLHGIPQRYVAQGDPYADQCRAGVEAIAKAAGLESEDWMLCFQSRVGREPWLQPYTDETVRSLAEQGAKSLQVACPGFAVDCLETLEEIAMQNAELFEETGGGKLAYIPALNDSEAHAQALAQIIREVAQPS